jgi:fibronectin type 3 domain-containing protein
MAADDYRRLFGSDTARQSMSFAGQDATQPPVLPQPEDVPGLRDFFMNVYNKSPVSTAPPAPSAPLTATATLSAEGPAVQLAWGASSGAASYEIYRNGAKIGSVNAPSTTYYDGNGLNYSTSYSYYIKPLSSTGTAGPASNTVTVTTPAPDTTKPTTPGSLTSPSQTQTSINLTWSAATDNVGVVGYRVYQVGGSRKNQFSTLLTTTTGTSYTVTGLTKGTSYSFYVTAIDAAGNESLPTKTLTVKTRR